MQFQNPFVISKILDKNPSKLVFLTLKKSTIQVSGNKVTIYKPLMSKCCETLQIVYQFPVAKLSPLSYCHLQGKQRCIGL